MNKIFFYEVLFLLLLLWLVTCVIGCVADGPLMLKSEQQLIRTKLQGIVQMNNQLGAVLGYNVQKFNGPQFRMERWMQVNQYLIPKSGQDFQKLMKGKSHMRRYGL